MAKKILEDSDRDLLKQLIEKENSEKEISNDDLSVLDPFINEITKIAKVNHLNDQPNPAVRRRQIEAEVAKLIKEVVD